MDGNDLTKKLKVLARNAALNMHCWACFTYTEKDYRRKKNLDMLEDILLDILLIVCIGIILFGCGG